MSTVTPSLFKGADRRLIVAILHGPRTQWPVWGGFARLDALRGKADTSQPRLVFVLMSGHVGQEMLKFLQQFQLYCKVTFRKDQY